jgi:hypothetical protein
LSCDSIQNVIEKKERSLVNLMKSSRELEFDNSIRSLSQNLQDLVQQETISAEDLTI